MDEAPGGTGTLEEEMPPVEEDRPTCPSAPKRKASMLLVSLLGHAFTEGTVQPKTAYARAEEEMDSQTRIRASPSVLTQEPTNSQMLSSEQFCTCHILLLLKRLKGTFTLILGLNIFTQI